MNDKVETRPGSEEEPGSAMEGVMDALDDSKAGEVARIALRHGVSQQDPIWPILRSLIEASGNVDQSAERLLRGLDERHRALGELATALSGQLGRSMRKTVAETFSEKIVQIEQATASVNKTIVQAQSQTCQTLHDVQHAAGAALALAAKAKSEEIANRWADQASEAVSKRLRAEARRQNATSLGRTAVVLLVTLILGGTISLAGAWAAHRIAPMTIKTCYRFKSGVYACELIDSEPFVRLPRW